MCFRGGSFFTQFRGPGHDSAGQFTRRPVSMNRPLVRLLLLSLLIVQPPANAIVTRHDVEEGASIELARRFPATAWFHRVSSRDGGAGMGTLIHPRWVLTAAHVADSLRDDEVVELGGATHAIEKVVKHPDWKGFRTFDDVGVDLALVKLRSEVKGVAPAKIHTGADETGMVVTFVGNGGSGTGLTGPVIYGEAMRAATNRVEKAEGLRLFFRFDRPGEPGVTPMEGVSGDGDSGGPAYVERGGSIFIVGVSSAQDARPTGRKIGHYGVLELYPRVSAHAEWIRTTLAAP